MLSAIFAVTDGEGLISSRFRRTAAMKAAATSHDEVIFGSWIRLLWMRVFGLRIDGAAVDGAAALLALHNPGLGKCGREPTHGDQYRRRKGENAIFVKLRLLMCGRYRLTAKERYLRDHFGLDVGVQWAPRWNIAPTQMIPTIRQHPKEPTRIFSLMRWGLIPYWAKDPSIGLKTINAMS